MHLKKNNFVKFDDSRSCIHTRRITNAQYVTYRTHNPNIVIITAFRLCSILKSILCNLSYLLWIYTTISVQIITKYKKRLLLRCMHHFNSDSINNMDHMRISATKFILKDIYQKIACLMLQPLHCIFKIGNRFSVYIINYASF